MSFSSPRSTVSSSVVPAGEFCIWSNTAGQFALVARKASTVIGSSAILSDRVVFREDEFGRVIVSPARSWLRRPGYRRITATTSFSMR